MSIDAINVVGTSPAAAETAAGRIPKKVLDQDDFLKLLVAQFTTQDPLNPQADMNSIAQMATFTSLEQTKVMQADIARLQADQQLATANSLIGRQVELRPQDGNPVSGVVTGALVVSDSPHIIVNNTAYPLGDVLSLTPADTHEQ